MKGIERTFIYLVLGNHAKESAVRNAAVTAISRHGEESLGHSAIKRILLVDDEEIFLWSLSEGLPMFLPGNFQMVTAENGAEAVKVLSSLPVDLVVTDLKMPVMDGFQLVAHIQDKYPGIPVMVMSASIGYAEEDRLLALGVTQCIEKPLTLGYLSQLIVDQLSEHTKQADPTGVDQRALVRYAA